VLVVWRWLVDHMVMVVGSAASRHCLMHSDVPVFQIENGQPVFRLLPK